jgi:hypothetical protein
MALADGGRAESMLQGTNGHVQWGRRRQILHEIVLKPFLEYSPQQCYSSEDSHDTEDSRAEFEEEYIGWSLP